MSSKPTRQMRSSSAFSIKGLVTSRSAVAAASWVASLATRVLRWTCTARYNTDNTTAIEPTNCEIALIASQFIAHLIPHAVILAPPRKAVEHHRTPNAERLTCACTDGHVCSAGRRGDFCRFRKRHGDSP